MAEANSIYQALKRNSAAFYDGIDYEVFRARNRALWQQAERLGIDDTVMALWRKDNPA